MRNEVVVARSLTLIVEPVDWLFESGTGFKFAAAIRGSPFHPGDTIVVDWRELCEDYSGVVVCGVKTTHL